MRRALEAAILVAIFGASGCEKRTEDSVVVAADGTCTVRSVAVMDLDAVIDGCAIFHGWKRHRSEVPANSVSGEDLKLMEESRRRELEAIPGLKVVTVAWMQDTAAREVTETVEVKTASLDAWVRADVSRAHERVEEASLAAADDGTWTFVRKGSVGAPLGAAIQDRFARSGPPKPLRPIPTILSIEFPGDVLEADAGARVDGKKVTWALEAKRGWRRTPFEMKVRFRGTKGLTPFHLLDKDPNPAEAAAEDGAGALAPLDGSGWRSEDGPADAGLAALHEPSSAPEGTVPVRGRVTHRGKPVAGAEIFFCLRDEDGSYGSRIAAKTDGDGRYDVAGVWPATYGVEVAVGKSGVWLPDLYVAKGPAVVRDVALGPMEIPVQVVDRENEPVEGAQVWLWNGRQAVLFGRIPTTGVGGTVRIPFVSPGECTIYACRNQAGSGVAKVVVGVGGTPAPVVLKLHPDYARVVVQVVDDDGTPSPACFRYKVADSRGVPDIQCDTDDRGYAVVFLSPGTWLLGLDSRDAAGDRDARFTAFARTLELKEGAAETVVLMKPRGAAPEKAK